MRRPDSLATGPVEPPDEGDYRWIVRVKTGSFKADFVREVRTERKSPDEAMIIAVRRIMVECTLVASDYDEWTVTIERVR